MGPDSVEIALKIEKTFGINIPYQEAEKIVTVGDLHQVVWQQTSERYSHQCNSQVLFYQLRQAFGRSFAFPQELCRLDTPINEIFPQDNRRQVYAQFARTSGLRLPDLVLTSYWSSFLNYFALVTIMGGLVGALLLIVFWGFPYWWLLLPVAGIGITWFTSAMLHSQRIMIGCSSLREFTQEVLYLNYTAMTKEKGTNRKEVESIINHIIADLAGIALQDITPEKKMTDDLGID